MNLHTIQRQILINLAKNPRLKYSEIRIENIENDLFNYHLQYLVKKGLVEKIDSKYNLTEKGINEILMIDSVGKEYEAIRASVLIYVIDRSANNNQILIHHRKRLPYKAETLPGISGKIKVGEMVEDTAKRKLLEETGLDGLCKYIGTIRKIRINRNNEADDGFFYVCICESWKNELNKETDFGINTWKSFNEALEYQKLNKYSGEMSYDVLNRVINGNYQRFFFEEVINVDSFN